MGCDVARGTTATDLPAEIPGEAPVSARYTPDEFVRELGVVLAACLGLALLAQLLVAIVGQY
jgi:hypothetical protein